LFNGKIHSFNSETPNITAVAIKDGKFIAVGNDSDIMELASEETKIIDLQNKRVVPRNQRFAHSPYSRRFKL
ncbi:hypothetical protein AB9T88_16915, partial [Flavobacterium sp. LBUM151]